MWDRVLRRRCYCRFCEGEGTHLSSRSFRCATLYGDTMRTVQRSAAQESVAQASVAHPSAAFSSAVHTSAQVFTAYTTA